MFYNNLIIVNKSVVIVLFILLTNKINCQFLNLTNNYHNFVITKINNDEIERTIKWQGICARETIINMGNTSIALREVSIKSGENLQLIYENNNLTECLKSNSNGNNICEELNSNSSITNNKINKIANWITSIPSIIAKCKKLESNIMIKNEIKHRRSERSLQQMVIAPGTKWCGPHRTASSYKDLGGLYNVDRCCRRHDHCCRSIPPFSQRYNFWNYMPFTLSHCGCDQRNDKNMDNNNIVNKKKIKVHKIRRKRRDIFMIPGTQWCGKGNRATKYTNLGGFSKADTCCRRHDKACPFYIPSFETRYGLFNWGLSTVMHCTCDERFRTCLKMAGTSSANFIGRIFFNIVQTKCFVLKPQKHCVKQSWWGKCEKYKYKKQAHLRDNVLY
ncbi:uncharacterized protein LOC122858750 [Aphidius gifuensis]|uniref:uncharacterized protein LOC122858750 n=1 Tax=Aphidius gifuensis TaxID=684658 RepID=UPI001CDB5E83|nr:uncharacterized protein LOC122858750 [Aphidius gifuensis]